MLQRLPCFKYYIVLKWKTLGSLEIDDVKIMDYMKNISNKKCLESNFRQKTLSDFRVRYRAKTCTGPGQIGSKPEITSYYVALSLLDKSVEMCDTKSNCAFVVS